MIRLGGIAAAATIRGGRCIRGSLVCRLILAIIILVVTGFVRSDSRGISGCRNGRSDGGVIIRVVKFVVARRRVRVDGRRRRTLRTNH